MKKLFIFLLFLVLSIFLFPGCDYSGPDLLLSYVEWYTTTEKIGELTFGYVHLQLTGSTTGDAVTVTTYGDGVIGEFELELNQEKKFSQDIVIKFTHEADNIERNYSTILTAYNGDITTIISLESEALAFLK